MSHPNSEYKPIAAEVAELAEKHDNRAEAALELLRDLQARNGGLSKQLIRDAARAVSTSPSHGFGIASFYSMLHLDQRQNTLRVCDGPVCWLKQSQSGRAALAKAVDGWTIERSSCLGLCDRAPAVLANLEPAGPVSEAVASGITGGWRGGPVDYSVALPGEVRVMLANLGAIDPSSIDSAIEYGAYRALEIALKKTPEAILAQVADAELRGRGGAGFSVGKKWGLVAQSKGSPKYIICNADESEPLLFKDRALIDADPHQLLEGIVLGGYACGASEAWIYVRGEYEQQAGALESAIEAAETRGYLGNRILGSAFSFKIHVHRGAGAYICGEETALIESLEGKRGEPRLRPPYPPQHGYRGQPTAVNNVESFCAVPHIIRNGVDWWKGLSAYKTPGTKIYMVLGHVNRPGLFEAPFGLTLRQVIHDFGGGMAPGSEFKFALCGGAAGTLVDAGLLDVPLDHDSGPKGISLGGGAFLVCDQTVSPVAFMRELLHFFAVESCGKCTPCRVGTWRAHEILLRLAAGRGQPGDVNELKRLSDHLLSSSFCGLGQSVAIPLASALEHFAPAFGEAEGARGDA